MSKEEAFDKIKSMIFDEAYEYYSPDELISDIEEVIKEVK